MKVCHAKTLKEAIDMCEEFLSADMYTKFRPEQKIGKEKWYREDAFENEKDFQEYLTRHFNILRKEIKRLGIKLK